ncbi:unnamed protein product, partial [Rotaria sp. Silwood2]
MWQWVCNWQNWTKTDEKLWYDGRYKLFTKRDGATCRFYGGLGYFDGYYFYGYYFGGYFHVCL